MSKLSQSYGDYQNSSHWVLSHLILWDRKYREEAIQVASGSEDKESTKQAECTEALLVAEGLALPVNILRKQVSKDGPENQALIY